MIGAIETKVIELIDQANGPSGLGYQLKKIETYGGEALEGIEKVIKNYPAVLLVYGGSTFVSKSNATYKMRGRWMLIVSAKNLRNESASRHGSGDKVGAYQICEDMMALLAHQNLGLEIEEIQIDGIRPIVVDSVTKDLAAIYAVEFSTAYIVSAQGVKPGLPDFAVAHLNWDIPPIGNVGPDLPSDETADATDHIELETT